MGYNSKADYDRRESLPAPKPGGSVWLRQSCPSFPPCIFVDDL